MYPQVACAVAILIKAILIKMALADCCLGLGLPCSVLRLHLIRVSSTFDASAFRAAGSEQPPTVDGWLAGQATPRLRTVTETAMANRILGVIVALILGGSAVYLARPYIDYQLYAATDSRPIEARGDLADFERTAIELFERVSPSVVQIVGRGAEVPTTRGEEAQVQTGTGFVWDQAGHVVTNDHVVEGANAIAVRLASGEAVSAQVVGVAPNYDLAVVRLSGVRQMPPPIAVGSSADLKVGQAAFAIGNP